MKNQAIERFILANGMTLIVGENPSADLIAARIFIKNAGARAEERNQAGLSHLVASLLTKGTEKLTALDIAQKVESIGASLNTETAADYFLISLKTVTADFAQMLELVAEILRFPSFPATEIDLEKHLTIQGIRSQKEQPFNIAFNQLRQSMYPQHPYGLSILGTEETVSQLTQKDLQNYHQNYFRPDNLIISLSGRINSNKALTLVSDIFADWEVKSQNLDALKFPILSNQPSQEITYQDSQQSIIMLGYLGAAVNHPDYFVLKLLSNYLGNGLSSRLFVELREKKGLAYDVSAFYPTRLDAAQFVTYIGTAPENTAIAFEGLLSENIRLCEEKLTPETLQIAKNKLLGQYALGKQTNAEIAQTFGWYETLGLGIEFEEHYPEKIASVTAEMIQEVANRYFIQPYVSLVGPKNALETVKINKF